MWRPDQATPGTSFDIKIAGGRLLQAKVVPSCRSTIPTTSGRRCRPWPLLEPHAQLRRSFVYRKLRDLGARFEVINGGAVAMDFGDDPAAEAERAQNLGLADLSPLPRTGFKGARRRGVAGEPRA